MSRELTGVAANVARFGIISCTRRRRVQGFVGVSAGAPQLNVTR